MSRLGGSVVATCAVALGASVLWAGPTRSAGMRWICPARFSNLPAGWAQGNAGSSPMTTTTDAWAHSHGFANLSDIPRSGIYVGVLLGTRGPTSPAPSALRRLRLPLDIRHPDQIGNDDGPLPEYRFAGRYHGLYVDVRVDFGRRRPSWSFRRRAQPVLAALRLPTALVSTPSACG